MVFELEPGHSDEVDVCFSLFSPVSATDQLAGHFEKTESWQSLSKLLVAFHSTLNKIRIPSLIT